MNTTKKINFLSAKDGKLKMHYEDSGVEKVLIAKTVEQVANGIDKVGGTDESLLCSSSMDFASENGFKTNEGAHQLWDKGYSVWLHTIQTQPIAKNLVWKKHYREGK